MTFELSIPLIGGKFLQANLPPGRVAFVIGPNGSGKSSLVHKIYISNKNRAVRIIAHRQNWLASNTPNLSPQQKVQRQESISVQDNLDAARWKDDSANFRAGIALYDLIDAEQIRARKITAAVDNKDMPKAEELSRTISPISKINQFLKSSNIPIEIFLGANQSVLSKKNGGSEFSAAELSDGERNALIVAATVLTAAENSLILVDEPERHLHRSIISPLLSQIIQARPDCSFVIATHDLSLPSDHPDSISILLRGCVYSGQKIATWNADLLSADTDIDQETRTAILGGRRTVAFIEGESNSLDNSLYTILFPDISIVPKKTRRDVEAQVGSIRDAQNLHWLTAIGIVDRDQEDEEQIIALRYRGVYSISAYSVESIYYHPLTQRLIAEKHAPIVGECADEQLARARQEIVKSAESQIDRLSARMSEKLIRDTISKQCPTWKDVLNNMAINLMLDVGNILDQERIRLRSMIDTLDAERIIERYPIRETEIPQRISLALGFKNRYQYEASVRAAASTDIVARQQMLKFFGPLSKDLEALK